MDEFTYQPIGETVYRERFDNGLEVLLLPKPGFHQTFAMFTTRFGSIDERFHVVGSNRTVSVPDGVAHFLEHKMFESPTMDVFQEFARHGAAANAFTTFDETAYLFSSTRDIVENMTLLLDYVQEPYFTDENVEKEKGIIGQEIRMYEDNPDSRSFLEFRKALFVNHPVRLDIAGSVESIRGIDKEMLYDCYNTFYHPANMVFVAAGGFRPAEVMDALRRNQAQKTFPEAPQIERIWPEEPTAVAVKRAVTYLPVTQPRCYIGWKDEATGLQGDALLRQELLTGLVLDTVFGKGSDLYHRLIDENLIDEQFSWEYECTAGYGYSLVGGNTPQPDHLVEQINAALAEIRRRGLSQEEFARNQRKTVGWFAMALDSPAAIVRNYSAYFLKGADWLHSMNLLQDITWEEANQRMFNHFCDAQQAVSTVLPKSVS